MNLPDAVKQWGKCINPTVPWEEHQKHLKTLPPSEKPCLVKDCPLLKKITIEDGRSTLEIEGCLLLGKLYESLIDQEPGKPYEDIE